MRKRNKISEASAEMLLNYLYPEMERKWVAKHEGAFYRNYNYDLLDVDAGAATVTLTRDGFLRLLPQGLLTTDEELKGDDDGSKFRELEQRRRILQDAFLPFDSFAFIKKLSIERKASELLDNKLAYLLKEYFGFDIEAEQNPLVRQAAVLLPYVSMWRGDFAFIRNLLAALMHCDVEMTIGRYSHVDTTVCWLPKVRYELMMPGLTPEGYREQREVLQPLADFMREWFIPFDVYCEILIKDHTRAAKEQVLDYNVELTE